MKLGWWYFSWLKYESCGSCVQPVRCMTIMPHSKSLLTDVLSLGESVRTWGVDASFLHTSHAMRKGETFHLRPAAVSVCFPQILCLQTDKRRLFVLISTTAPRGTPVSMSVTDHALLLQGNSLYKGWTWECSWKCGYRLFYCTCGQCGFWVLPECIINIQQNNKLCY